MGIAIDGWAQTGKNSAGEKVAEYLGGVLVDSGRFYRAITKACRNSGVDIGNADAVPEVRRFYAALHQVWPYWIYFCDLRDDRLKLMVFCCLNNLTTLKVEGRANYVTEFSPRDLVRFVADDFIPMNEMCERANMTDREVYDRSKAVFEYFGFAYNAAPPT